MSRNQSEEMPKPLRVLLETGSMAGMTDGQLVDRFASGRDSGGEAAFAALVSRHGPMVLSTCRHLLDDPHTADDVFQAVFLVLGRGPVRSASPICWDRGCTGLPQESAQRQGACLPPS